MNSKKSDFFQPHGYTQTGKSSVIITIAGGKASENGVKAGDGSGKSETGSDGTIPKPVKAMIGDREVIIQDTVGYHDTEMKFTDKEIKDFSRASLLESGKDSVKFLLTACLGSNSADLKRTYEKLASTYSQDVRDSTVVLVTKPNMANEFLQDRLAQVQKDCKELGLPYMMFETDYKGRNISQNQKEAQNKELLEIADRVKPFKIQELADQLDQINKKAQAQYAAGPERQVNCVAKQRKIGESNTAGRDTLSGLAAGSVFGPVGMALGAFGGLFGGLLNTRDKFEPYLDCQTEKIHSIEKYKNDILRENAQKMREDIYKMRENNKKI